MQPIKAVWEEYKEMFAGLGFNLFIGLYVGG